MTKQQFDDLYLGKAVHCDTEEKANDFLKLAHGFGWKWRSGRSLLEKNNYDYEQEETCYLVGRDGFEYSAKSFYIEESYEVVEFKQEKENKMKYKVGDKVRVKSGLRKGQLLGISLETYHKDLENEVFTIRICLKNGIYMFEETVFALYEGMLESVEESFNVGDVVYNKNGKRLVIEEVVYYAVDIAGNGCHYETPELSKTKPLQKITRKELADMGYMLVD